MVSHRGPGSSGPCAEEHAVGRRMSRLEGHINHSLESWVTRLTGRPDHHQRDEALVNVTWYHLMDDGLAINQLDEMWWGV